MMDLSFVKAYTADGKYIGTAHRQDALHQTVGDVIVEQIKNFEKDIERFAAQNKDDFAKTRNKRLNFGKISYKVTTSVVCKFVDSAVKVLKSYGLTECIRVKEELDKQAILGLESGASQYLSKAGISIKIADKLSIEPDYIKLAGNN